MNSISFDESQFNVGDNYYIYIEDGNAHVSCYFWFDSLEQLLLSIKDHCDFWQWGNGLEQAKYDLSNIIDSQLPTAEFDDELINDVVIYPNPAKEKIELFFNDIVIREIQKLSRRF